MKKKTVLFAAMIALISMLVSSFAACGKKEEPPQGEIKPPEETTSTGDREDLKKYLPEFETYNGARILVRIRNDEETKMEMGTEENPGVKLSEALYKRTCAVEKDLECSIEVSLGESWSRYNAEIAAIRVSVLGSYQSWDIIGGWSARIPTLAAEGLFYDFNSLTKYFRSDAPWWSSSILEATTVNNRMYMVTGDISTTYMDSCYATYVNDVVATALGYQYEDFYTMVTEGSWTLDTMMTLIENGYIDHNGNGVCDEGDRFGVVLPGCETSLAFWAGSDLNIVDMGDGTVRPTIGFDKEKIQSVNEKLIDLFINNENSMVFGTDKALAGFSANRTASELFSNNLSLFVIDKFLAAPAFSAEMKTNYGILPIPKYDQNQKDYRTCVQVSMTLFAVPIDAKDKDTSAAVITSMGYNSRLYVLETHYDELLKTKYVRDSYAGEMIDLIYNSVYMNFDSIFNEAMGESLQQKDTMPLHIFWYRMKAGDKSTSSWFASNETGIIHRFEAIIDQFYEIKS